MAQPILARLSRGNPDDLATMILPSGEELEHEGIYRFVDIKPNYTFKDLVERILDPNANEHNAEYTPSQREIAGTYRNEVQVPDVKLFGKSDGNYNLEMRLEDKVSNHLGSLVEHLQLDGENYKHVDLRYSVSSFGGAYDSL
ncbi:MAG: hypothetical protein ACMXYF_00435 [Candidatus Woesearchaeota archaeon]